MVASDVNVFASDVSVFASDVSVFASDVRVFYLSSNCGNNIPSHPHFSM